MSDPSWLWNNPLPSLLSVVSVGMYFASLLLLAPGQNRKIISELRPQIYFVSSLCFAGAGIITCIILSSGDFATIFTFYFLGVFVIVPLGIISGYMFAWSDRVIFGANDCCRNCGSKRPYVKCGPPVKSTWTDIWILKCPDCGYRSEKEVRNRLSKDVSVA